MNQEKSQLVKDFEKEYFLFIDGDLPDDRMDFWNQKLNEFPELKEYLNDFNLVSTNYNSEEISLSNKKFNEMVDTTINNDSLFIKIINFFRNLFSSNSEFAFGKIAFASVLIIIAVVISFLSKRPNPVVNATNTINAELLEWDADYVDNQINKVGDLLKVAKDDDYRKYYKYKLSTSKNVDKNINLLNKNIESLKEELNSKNL